MVKYLEAKIKIELINPVPRLTKPKRCARVNETDMERELLLRERGIGGGGGRG